MTAQITFDQTGLPAGVPGKARDDGLDNGATVTVTNGSGQPCTCSFWWKPPDDGAAALTQNGPNQWEFTPTAARYGTYTVIMVEAAGTENETIDVKDFGIRLPTSSLLIPPLNGRGDFDVNLSSTIAEKAAAAVLSYNNVTNAEGLDYVAWWQSQRELYEFVESMSGGFTTYDGLTDTPNSKAGEAGRIPMVNGAETDHTYEIWNKSMTGVAWNPSVASVPEDGIYQTWAEVFAAAMANPGLQTIVMMGIGTVTYTIDGGVTHDCENRLRLLFPQGTNGGATLNIDTNTQLLNPHSIIAHSMRGTAPIITVTSTLGSANTTAIRFTSSYRDFYTEGVQYTHNGTRPAIKYETGSSQRLVIGPNTILGADSVATNNRPLEVWITGDLINFTANCFNNPDVTDTLTIHIVDGQDIGAPSDYTTSWAGTVVFSYEHDAHHSGFTPTTSGDWNPVPTEVGSALDQLAANRVFQPTGGSSTDNAIVRWDGATGTIVQDSALTISDAGDLDLEENTILAQRRTIISPTAIAATQNDYDPTDFGTCEIMRLTLTGNQTVTGFAAPAAGENEHHFFINTDTTDILSIPHQTGSVAANQVLTPNGETVRFGPGEIGMILYDSSASRWQLFKLNGQLHYTVAAWFAEQVDNGNTGASQTVTWANGNKQRSELNAATVTVTHTFPGVGNYIWIVEQDATTQCTSLTIAVTGGSARFPDGELNIGAAANARTLVSIYYDGTNADFTSAPNLATGSVVFI